jgi:hypothetical protein
MIVKEIQDDWRVLGSTETEAVDRVVNAPKFAQWQRLTPGREHTLRAEPLAAGFVEALDVPEHLTRAAGNTPELVVELNKGDAKAVNAVARGGDQRVGCDEIQGCQLNSKDAAGPTGLGHLQTTRNRRHSKACSNYNLVPSIANGSMAAISSAVSAGFASVPKLFSS